MATVNCGVCSSENDDSLMYCGQCGQPLVPAPPPPIPLPRAPRVVCVDCLAEADPVAAGGLCPACMAQLGDTGLVLVFPSGRIGLCRGMERLLGRDPADCPDAELFTSYDNVSRRHARIRLSAAGDATVEDNGSTNGTYIDDTEIASGIEHPLGDGQELRLAADLRCEVRIAGR